MAKQQSNDTKEFKQKAVQLVETSSKDFLLHNGQMIDARVSGIKSYYGVLSQETGVFQKPLFSRQLKPTFQEESDQHVVVACTSK